MKDLFKMAEILSFFQKALGQPFMLIFSYRYFILEKREKLYLLSEKIYSKCLRKKNFINNLYFQIRHFVFFCNILIYKIFYYTKISKNVLRKRKKKSKFQICWIIPPFWIFYQAEFSSLLLSKISLRIYRK
jgi:hypothetical protein